MIPITLVLPYFGGSLFRDTHLAKVPSKGDIIHTEIGQLKVEYASYSVDCERVRVCLEPTAWTGPGVDDLITQTEWRKTFLKATVSDRAKYHYDRAKKIHDGFWEVRKQDAMGRTEHLAWCKDEAEARRVTQTKVIDIDVDKKTIYIGE